MNDFLNVSVVMARCNTNRKSFGIRLEERRHGHWTANWAFAIKEQSAKREGYDRNEMKGSFEIADEYPGCPYCEGNGMYKCGSCGKVACWDSVTITVTCPTCGVKADIGGDLDSLTGGDY